MKIGRAEIWKLDHVLLGICTVVLVVSGLGITKYQVVGPLTFGLLSKGRAFRVHSALTWPFIILFALHVYMAMMPKLPKWMQVKWPK